MKKVLETVGWTAVIVITIAYVLLSIGYLSPTGFTYQFMNFMGSLGLISISIPKKAWQPAIMNIIWGTIALISVIKIILN